MKKKLVSSSKRKWVTNGVLAFGAIALLTTGFATWIIGAQTTSAINDGTTVTVDTAENSSVRIEITELDEPNNSIKLAETSKVTGTIVNTDENPGGDLEIGFKVTVAMGQNYIEEGKEFKGLKFTLPTTKEEVTSLGLTAPENWLNEKLKVIDSSSSTNTNVAPDYINKRKDSDYYYLELATKTAAYEGDTPEAENGVLTYEFNVTLNFDWGTYFKYDDENTENHDRTPANYYNNVLTEDYNREDLAGKTAIEQNIKKEMDDMSKALTSSNDTNNGAKLHVICSIDVGDAAVSG